MIKWAKDDRSLLSFIEKTKENMNTMDSNIVENELMSSGKVKNCSNNRITIRLPDEIRQLQKVPSSSSEMITARTGIAHNCCNINSMQEQKKYQKKIKATRKIVPPSTSSSHDNIDQDMNTIVSMSDIESSEFASTFFRSNFPLSSSSSSSSCTTPSTTVSAATTSTTPLSSSFHNKMMKQKKIFKQCGSHHLNNHNHPSRPILVGYAFGPKKMNTMSVVMAEASMAVSTVVTHILPKTNHNLATTTSTIANDIPCNHHKKKNLVMKNKKRRSAQEQNKNVADNAGTHASSSSEEMYYCDVNDNEEDSNMMKRQKSNPIIEEQRHKHCNGSDNNYNSCNDDLQSQSYYTHSLHDDDVDENGNDADDHDDKYDESSVNTHTTEVDSMISNSCITATTSSSVTTTTNTTAISCIFPSNKNTNNNGTTTSTKSPAKYIQIPQHYQPMRVSFVPLDLNSPLEEQHGGKFDAILHKMTEDILCKSQLNTTIIDDTTSTKSTLEPHEKDAMKRIKRLLEYKNDHPACCLVDHPSNVEAVMSRSNIAQRLTQCLRGITTKSGIRVFTPRYLVLQPNNCNDNENGNIKKQIENAPFTYPVIIKPLTAAGTAESHRMGILLSHHGISKVQNTNNSIIQEYANHDGKLYKVYVLGNRVWVFPRPSLPNLPMGKDMINVGNGNITHHYVDFDSQRPYPTLCDFGVTTSSNDDLNDINTNKNGDDLSVTSEEIRPVADCIRRAFGLELFGFDIIVTKTKSDQYQQHHISKSKCRKKKMYVVDVNYFPSYKEVTNFSELLAQYLAQCGIEGRVRSFESER
jgi:inositol-1,3,4-trisphosphate 5/6-kinase/inositol-tetrakisphosphate 1-kinase